MLDYGNNGKPTGTKLSFPIYVPMSILACGSLPLLISSCPITSSLLEVLQRFVWYISSGHQSID